MAGGEPDGGGWGCGLDEETPSLSGTGAGLGPPDTCTCVCMCAREPACVCEHMSMHVHMRGPGPGPAASSHPRAHIAEVTHTQAADGVVASMTCTAAPQASLQSGPQPLSQAATELTKAGHPAQVTTVGSGGRGAWTPGHYLSGS